ncbi:hypothetical protein [Streptomyces aidingensis]|uniref:Lipoprotein n=1 Tax=Streptomyces aidingensis TaxID=910347 RepID=A0A1I1T6G2_9ACTN|nr:hypothetical protein [Streptomyces aidingensis]SFD54182.1 hypothetical protein SAMN05421773_11861 [Streptomyces aidingensis]
MRRMSGARGSLLTALVCAGLLTACDSGESGEERPATAPVAADGEGLVPDFVLALPQGTRLDRDDDRLAHGLLGDGGAGCRPLAWDDTGDDAPGLTVYAANDACAVDEDVHDHPLNGRHPVYRSAEDIPGETAAAGREVTTPLGTALLFTQTYTECTNSCEDFDEPFAVITLSSPADPGYRSLVFTSLGARLSLEELETMVVDRLSLP